MKSAQRLNKQQHHYFWIFHLLDNNQVVDLFTAFKVKWK